jgi:hypothetical protein
MILTAAHIVIMDPVVDGGGGGDRWYMITVGPQVGVFRGWETVGPLVLGHPQAVYQRVESRVDGIARFTAAMDNGSVRIL